MTRVGVFWDAGLVYRDERGTFAPVCIPAERAMMTFWANSNALPMLSTIHVLISPVRMALIHSTALQNDSEYGVVFEQGVVEY